MDQVKPIDQFKRRVAWLLLLALVAHLSISFYLTVSNQRKNSNSFVTYYNRYLLLGPFFNEEHIHIAPHLLIRYEKKTEGWSSFTDYGINNFSTFLHSPWRYDKLKESDYLRHIMRLAYLKIGDRTFIEYKNDPEFRELNSYINGELLPSKTDSIQLIYVFKTFSKTTGQDKIDTVLNVHYNPYEVESSR